MTPPSRSHPLTLGLPFSSYSFSFNPNSTTGVNISLFSSQPLFHILYLPLRYLLRASDLEANTYLTSPCGCHKGTSTQHDRNRPLSLPSLCGSLLLVPQPVMANTSIQLYKPATQGKLVPSPLYPNGHQISLIFASLLCHRSSHFSPTLPPSVCLFPGPLHLPSNSSPLATTLALLHSLVCFPAILLLLCQFLFTDTFFNANLIYLPLANILPWLPIALPWG